MKNLLDSLINSIQIKQSLLTLKSLTKSSNEVLDILARLQIIKQKTDKLWKTNGEVVARTYQQAEFRKIINSIL